MTDSTSDRTPEVRVSVCMATYRGGRYVEEQIVSILKELGPSDELVVVDDASPDDTVRVIKAISDERVRLVRAAENRGYVRTFEAAIGHSRGKYIFLADQDDVWIPGRLEKMMEALYTHKVVASNFQILGGGPRPWIPPLKSSDSDRRFANLFGILIGYRAYYGCAMGFRRDAMRLFIPIPAYVRESHDLWLAICGNVAGSMAHLDEATVYRRLHDENQTPAGWRSLSKIVRSRVMLMRLVVEAMVRTRAPF